MTDVAAPPEEVETSEAEEAIEALRDAVRQVETLEARVRSATLRLEDLAGQVDEARAHYSVMKAAMEALLP